VLPFLVDFYDSSGELSRVFHNLTKLGKILRFHQGFYHKTLDMPNSLLIDAGVLPVTVKALELVLQRSKTDDGYCGGHINFSKPSLSVQNTVNLKIIREFLEFMKDSTKKCLTCSIVY
jgi:hypothetical protein